MPDIYGRPTEDEILEDAKYQAVNRKTVVPGSSLAVIDPAAVEAVNNQVDREVAAGQIPNSDSYQMGKTDMGGTYWGWYSAPRPKTVPAEPIYGDETKIASPEAPVAAQPLTAHGGVLAATPAAAAPAPGVPAPVNPTAVTAARAQLDVADRQLRQAQMNSVRTHAMTPPGKTLDSSRRRLLAQDQARNKADLMGRSTIEQAKAHRDQAALRLSNREAGRDDPFASFGMEGPAFTPADQIPGIDPLTLASFQQDKEALKKEWTEAASRIDWKQIKDISQVADVIESLPHYSVQMEVPMREMVKQFMPATMAAELRVRKANLTPFAAWAKQQNPNASDAEIQADMSSQGPLYQAYKATPGAVSFDAHPVTGEPMQHQPTPMEAQQMNQQSAEAEATFRAGLQEKERIRQKAVKTQEDHEAFARQHAAWEVLNKKDPIHYNTENEPIEGAEGITPIKVEKTAAPSAQERQQINLLKTQVRNIDSILNDPNPSEADVELALSGIYRDDTIKSITDSFDLVDSGEKDQAGLPKKIRKISESAKKALRTAKTTREAQIEAYMEPYKTATTPTAAAPGAEGPMDVSNSPVSEPTGPGVGGTPAAAVPTAPKVLTPYERIVAEDAAKKAAATQEEAWAKSTENAASQFKNAADDFDERFPDVLRKIIKHYRSEHPETGLLNYRTRPEYISLVKEHLAANRAKFGGAATSVADPDAPPDPGTAVGQRKGKNGKVFVWNGTTWIKE